MTFFGVATGGLEGKRIRVRFPAEDTDFSVLHNLHTNSGPHTAFYTLDTGGSSLGNKAARA
jgi:hypothetical protein